MHLPFSDILNFADDDLQLLANDDESAIDEFVRKAFVDAPAVVALYSSLPKKVRGSFVFRRSRSINADPASRPDSLAVYLRSWWCAVPLSAARQSLKLCPGLYVDADTLSERALM